MEINENTLYYNEYCTNFTGGTCQQWTTVLGIGKQEIKELGTSVFVNSFVFLGIILVLFYALRFIFYIFKGKSK